MTDEAAPHGVIVVLHDNEGRPARAGDEITTYVLGEPWPYAPVGTHDGHSADLFGYEDAVLTRANGDGDWRLESQVHCDCAQRRAVGQVLIHVPTSRRWGTAKPERVPAAFRRDDVGHVEGWVLHPQSDKVAPHLGGVASCNGCKKRWLLVSFADTIEKVHIADAKHGTRLAP